MVGNGSRMQRANEDGWYPNETNEIHGKIPSVKMNKSNSQISGTPVKICSGWLEKVTVR